MCIGENVEAMVPENTELPKWIQEKINISSLVKPDVKADTFGKLTGSPPPPTDADAPLPEQSDVDSSETYGDLPF